MKTVLLVHCEESLRSLSLAARVAAASGDPLVLLCASQDSVSRLDSITEADDQTPGLVAAARTACEERQLSKATAYDCRAPSLKRGILDALRELEASLLIVSNGPHEPSVAARNLASQLARAAPIDVLLVDVGRATTSPLDRVVFAQYGGGGAHGIRFAVRHLASKDSPVVVVPDPGFLSRSARVFRRVRERYSGDQRECLELVDTDDSRSWALGPSLESGGLLLADAESAGDVSRHLASLREARKKLPEVDVAIGITRTANARGAGTMERLGERLRRHLPTLVREERTELHEQLEQGGRLSADFVIMLVASASIAALGLIQNSTSVVIGAMLVAPLMTPILAAGMALVQGNSKLFRSAVTAMVVGSLAALIGAMAIGLTSPWSDLSSEIIARGSPNLFDLGIAFLSGIAAAFAVARPKLVGTLVGVAIAVALVPPLAAAGIATVKSEFRIAFGASVLFATNLFAITVGASLVFRLFGLDRPLAGSLAPAWVRRTLAGVTVGLLLTSGILIQNLSEQIHEGVQRAYARPLPPALRDAVTARVAREEGVQIILMAQSGIEHGFGVTIALASERSLGPELKEQLESMIRREMGPNVPATVLSLHAQSMAKPEP